MAGLTLGVSTPVWLVVVAVCLSYGGYEFVRAASVAMFLSEIGAAQVPSYIYIIYCPKCTPLPFYKMVHTMLIWRCVVKVLWVKTTRIQY